MNRLTLVVLVGLGFTTGTLRADVTLPSVIGNRMVLQREQAVPVWGWDDPETEVTVTFAGQSVSA